jgi:enoyl-CoA hydratase/carnithine racemase
LLAAEVVSGVEAVDLGIADVVAEDPLTYALALAERISVRY